MSSRLRSVVFLLALLLGTFATIGCTSDQQLLRVANENRTYFQSLVPAPRPPLPEKAVVARVEKVARAHMGTWAFYLSKSLKGITAADDNAYGWHMACAAQELGLDPRPWALYGAKMCPPRLNG